MSTGGPVTSNRGRAGYTREELARIRAPVVIATGDHDELILRGHALGIVASIPDARLVIFSDTGHFAPWQDPEAFNRAVLEFLGDR